MLFFYIALGNGFLLSSLTRVTPPSPPSFFPFTLKQHEERERENRRKEKTIEGEEKSRSIKEEIEDEDEDEDL